MTKANWLNENKELIISVFELDVTDVKSIEATISNLEALELEWSSKGVTLSELINTWVEFSNVKKVTVNTLLEGFLSYHNLEFKADISYVDLCNLIAFISYSYNDRVFIRNSLKSIVNRISQTEVISKLKNEGIAVNNGDSFTDVLVKIKNQLNSIEDEVFKNEKLMSLSTVLGGTYHTSKVVNLLK